MYQDNGLLESLDDEAKLIVDIGHLRDLDHTPENIKQLS